MKHHNMLGYLSDMDTQYREYSSPLEEVSASPLTGCSAGRMYRYIELGTLAGC